MNTEDIYNVIREAIRNSSLNDDMGMTPILMDPIKKENNTMFAICEKVSYCNSFLYPRFRIVIYDEKKKFEHPRKYTIEIPKK